MLCTASCTDTPEPFVVSSGDEAFRKSLNYTFCDYINDESVVVEATTPDEALYFRDLLEGEGLAFIYDEIVYTAAHLSNPVEGIDTMSQVYFQKPVTQEQLDRVYMFLYAEHPEFWYLRLPTYKGCVLSEGSDRMAYLSYGESMKDIPAMNEEVLTAAEAVVKEATHGLKKEEDILSALCGYLCENNEMSDEEFSQRPYLSMKEVLLEKQGSCLSHVRALNFLLHQCEIPAIIGAGTLSGGSYLTHYWTITPHDGIYYYTDLYYMGQIYNGSEEHVDRYLLCDDETMVTYREIGVAQDIVLAGSAVGSGETGDGVYIGTESMNFPADTPLV